MPKKELCRLAKISRATFYEIEAGKGTRHDIVTRLADALGYELELVMKSDFASEGRDVAVH